MVVVAGGACGSSVLHWVPSFDFDLEVNPCFNYTPAVDLSPSLYWEYAVRSTAITITLSNTEVCRHQRASGLSVRDVGVQQQTLPAPLNIRCALRIIIRG